MGLNIFTVRLQLLAATEQALDDAKLRRGQRHEARERVRGMWRSVLREAMEEFAAARNLIVAEDDGTDTPILDFWRELIAAGKIQEFIRFLVAEVLPAVLQVVMLFLAA